MKTFNRESVNLASNYRITRVHRDVDRQNRQSTKITQMANSEFRIQSIDFALEKFHTITRAMYHLPQRTGSPELCNSIIIDSQRTSN